MSSLGKVPIYREVSNADRLARNPIGASTDEMTMMMMMMRRFVERVLNSPHADALSSV